MKYECECPNCKEKFSSKYEQRPFAYHSCSDGSIGCVKRYPSKKNKKNENKKVEVKK